MKGNNKKRKSLHCPVCDSDEIYTIVGGYTGNLYKCKKCGYQGALVIEHDNDLNDEFEEAASYNKTDDNLKSENSKAKTALEIILAVLVIFIIYLIFAGIRF